MALLKIYCPSCKTGYEIDDSLSGEKVECGVCSKKFLVQKQEERATLRRNSALTIDDANKFWGKSISPEIKPYVSIRPDNISSGTIPDIKPRGMKLAESSTSSTISHDIVLLKQIGSGSMGQVHRSLQSSVDRNVAVKTLEESIATDESSRNSFIREALVTASLDHPNIVPVHELAIDENGRLFYSMKELKGKSWEDAMDFIQLDENLEILLKTCDAVAFAHSKGVIHRDLKPANVMIGEFGEVCLIDWGIAVSMEGAELADKAVPRKEAGKAGTPAYMSPEMATDEYLNIGHHSDIYLLGAILFEIISGEAPHDSNDVFISLAMAMNNETVKTDVIGELMDIALKAMASKPQDRYASVNDFQEAIKKYQANKESVRLTEKANVLLLEATKENSYEKFRQSRSGFIGAFKIWPENREAEEGVVKSTETFARLAMEKGDVNMAAFLLTSTAGTSEELTQKAVSAKAAIDRRDKTLKLIQLLALIFSLAGLIFVFTALKNFYYLPVHLENLTAKIPLKTAYYDLQTEDLISKTDRIAFQNADILKNKMKKNGGTFIIPPEFLKCSSINDYAVLIKMASHLIDEKEYECASKILESLGKSEFKGWELDHLLFLCANKDLPRFNLESVSNDDRYGSMIYLSPGGKFLFYGKSLFAIGPIRKLYDLQIPVRNSILSAVFSNDSKSLYIVTRENPIYSLGTTFQAPDSTVLYKYEFDVNTGKMISQNKIEIPVNLINLSYKSGNVQSGTCSYLSPELKTLVFPKSDRDAKTGAFITKIMVHEIPSGKEILSYALNKNEGFYPLSYKSENEILVKLQGQEQKSGQSFILDIPSGIAKDYKMQDEEAMQQLFPSNQQSYQPSVKADSPDGKRIIAFDLKSLKIYDKETNLPLLDVPIIKADNNSSIQNQKISFMKDGAGILLFWSESRYDSGSQRSISSFNLAAFPSTGFEKSEMFRQMQFKRKFTADIKQKNLGYNGEGMLSFDADGKLVYVYADFLRVSSIVDVSFLKGQPLKKLSLSYTQVADISPLKDMKLEALDLNQTKVSDLSPLKGMPLKELNLINLRMSDIEPLRNMPLEILYLWNAPVTDLSVLKGMPLKELYLINSKVKDLSPIQGMQLKILLMEGSMDISDISVLKNMSTLECLTIPQNPSLEIGFLRQMENIRILDYAGGNTPYKDAQTFWKGYDSQKK